MTGPFTRNCAELVDEKTQAVCLAPVESSISESGHESMWCQEGHQIKEWYVLDAEGTQIALAKLNSSPQILDAEMMIKLSMDPLFSRTIRPPKPTHLCKRGHNDWYMNPDERYRCRQCKRERYERVRKAKGHKERGPKQDPEETKRKLREKIKERYHSDPDFRKRRNAASRKYWKKYALKKKGEK